MSATEQSSPSLDRAARRIAWASRALGAAASDLHAFGATGAGEVIAEEAERVSVLASEVQDLETAPVAE
jgi:hypothetical protein